MPVPALRSAALLCLFLTAAPAVSEDAANLVEALRQAGLQEVRAVPVRGNGALVNVEGVLPGKTADEIVLSAASGDASGCAAVISAAADLRRTPLRHTVRVVLFGGESGGGMAGWLRNLGPGAEERILAHLNLERVGRQGSAGPVIEGSPAMPPGWLVHSVLKSGEAVAWPFAVADNRFPLLAQLVVRSVEVRNGPDSEPFLRRGIPSVSLSDGSLTDAARHEPDARRLDRWTQAAAAAVRRLDALAGRPLPEDQYLAVAGRVWLRRDLIWLGFLPWVLLVFRGRPGRWRGTPADQQNRQMRSYLPGFLFRGLLLLAIFLAPVFAVLLLPAAALALAPPRLWRPWIWIPLGLLPLVFYLAAVGVGLVNGIVSLDGGFRGGGAAALLIPATLVAYVLMIARGRERLPQLPVGD
ncbi:MAG TPA: M28 family peptidase [Thermoanaerobaculia bacterium]|nr:M28 family peptidase [Thermoanaerobaculia bacterium]